MADRVFIIAEAGVNHNGDGEMALALVDAAARAGADAVKFQTFKAESLAAASAAKAEYQKAAGAGGESQLEMLRRLELGEERHRELMGRSAERKIQFLSSPFDTASLDFLVNGLALETLKIPSGEITNGPLLLAAARSGAAVICSTGMSTMEEVADALAVLAFGYATADERPSGEAFAKAFAAKAGQRALGEKVVLLHCTSQYPAPFEDVNLKAMDTLADAFGLPVGLSDHSPGISVPIAAAARGASLIEKHFTLDRSLPGPDHKASLEPGEFGEMVKAIRQIEAALGDGVKQPAPAEMGTREVVRKSLMSACPLSRGQAFTAATLAVKRPGGGISPMRYWDWLGRPANRDYSEDEPIEA